MESGTIRQSSPTHIFLGTNVIEGEMSYASPPTLWLRDIYDGEDA